jgi:hypothetical protein
VFELVDKVDHVLAHGRPVDAVDEAAVLEAGVLRFHLLDDLLAKGADLGRARDGHVLVALVLRRHGVKGPHVLRDVGAQIGPEFHQEKGVLRTLVEELLEAALFLGEFVVDLPDINRLIQPEK